MYREFAQVYDRLMDDVDYPAWAEYYLALLSEAGVRPRAMAECGCGTGGMTIPFARRGIQVAASDLSGEMLMLAADKARRAGVKAQFVRQDMREMRVPKPVDAVVCACDGVNYLTGDGDAAAFFAAAYRALKPGGALAFDVSSPEKLARMTGDRLYFEDRDDVTYLWLNEPGEGGTVKMDLTFFVKEKDGRYIRFDESQFQRAYGIKELEALLAEAGFESVRTYGDKTMAAPAAGEDRFHITARKANL